jgi:hypothetical protein
MAMKTIWEAKNIWNAKFKIEESSIWERHDERKNVLPSIAISECDTLLEWKSEEAIAPIC